MKRRILFVEPDTVLLGVYVKLLERERDRWEVLTATTAAQALEMMAQEPEVVVSDADLPGISSEMWMNEVRNRCAGASRIIISEVGNQAQIARSLNATHQFLPKPFEVEALRYALSRVEVLDAYLRVPAIKSLVRQVGTLPSLPSLYVQVMQELNSDDPSVERVAATIGQDPSMTARILQIVNSAAIGLARRISNPFEAVQYLGFGTVRSLVLAAHIFSSFSARPGLKGFSIQALWSHATVTGMLARMVMRLERSAAADADDANIAGMLHDIGKLILADRMPDRFQQAWMLATERNVPLHETEMEIFGATHAGVGAYLFGLWGLPASVVEAVAFHHAPAENPLRAFSPLTAVHVANVLEHEFSQVKDADRLAVMDQRHLAALGLAERVDTWRAEAERMIARWDEGE